VERLLRASVRILPQARVAGEFAFTLTGTRDPDGIWQLSPSGTSRRHGAIAALGLMRLPQHEQRTVLGGEDGHDFVGRLARRLDWMTNLGDVALLCWAAAEAAHGELPRAVHLGPPVAAGRPVRQRNLHLSDPHPDPVQVDSQRRLDAEPWGERAGRLERGTGEAALPVERLRGEPAGGGGGFGGGFGGGQGAFRRGIDEETLKRVADITGGTYYPAESAEQLEGVFQGLPTNLITKHEVLEIGVGFVAFSAAFAALALLLGRAWRPLP